MSNLFNNPDNLVDVVRQILSGKPLEEKKKEEELDPVNKQAVKKKFDDRKDKDIDNDGDVDSTDKYLHKRRKAISKSLNEKEPKKKINASHCEEVELDEVGGSAFGGTIDKIQKVVDDKQATKIDGVMVDTFTASLIMKIFNRVNKQNQDKMRKMKVTQLAKAAYKVAGMKEEVELDENYRKAALKGIGAETANSIKVGTGVDYYSPKDGSKHMGKITRMDKNGYEVKDDKTGKTFKFKYYSKDAMKEETLDEAEHEDGDGEKMTDAQKKDMDGDGEKDTGEKKKKKKKDEKGEKEDEAKPDKVNTEPEMDNVKTMMSEREMTDKEKAKLDKLKKKYEGGEMHKSIKDQYGDKADEVFYGKLTKMAMGEGVDLNEAEGSVKVKAGPNHDRKLKSIIDLAKKMGLKVTRQGKSDDGKMTTVHLKGNQKKIIDMQALGPRLDEGVELEEDKKELAKISKELEGASKMHKGQSDRIKKIIGKDDVKEAKDDEKDTNLIMQLRKAVSLRGNKVDFKQGTEVVPANVAQAFLTKYAKLKRPAEKDMLSQSAHKSLKHLKMAIKGKVEKPKSSGVDLPKLKSEK